MELMTVTVIPAPCCGGSITNVDRAILDTISHLYRQGYRSVECVDAQLITKGRIGTLFETIHEFTPESAGVVIRVAVER